jgi:hypothetical protein
MICIMDIHNVLLKCRNTTLLYIAYIFFDLDETKFSLPLDDIMVND